jgi:NADP-dependent aldehyde dehydrogenase
MSSGFRTFNPSQNCWNPEVYYPTSLEELDQKLTLLPFAQSEYGRLSIGRRADFLQAIHHSLSKKKNNIQKYYLNESGLSVVRFETEWKRTLDTIELFEKYLRDGYFAFEKTQEFPADAISIRKIAYPIGPVLVLGSSNFPLAYSTAGGDTISALAAGCCVVVKAHAMHVGTSSIVADCIHEAVQALNLPNGIFTHVLDDGIQLAQKLCADERIHAVGFTGSFKGGKALMDIANSRKNPIPVFAEMGSANPVVLLNGISQEKRLIISEKLAHSITNDAGQFCTKPGILFVQANDEGLSFIDTLKSFVEKTAVVPMLHPDIHRNFEHRKNETESIPEVKIHQSPIENKGIEGQWAIAETTLPTFLHNPSLQEEVFGPFSLIVTYRDSSELKSGLSILSGQLTGSVFFEENSTMVEECIELLSKKVGRIILNDVPTGVRVVETMQHGGPFPASSDVRFTAVGPDSLFRFQKYVSIQQKNIS